MSGGNIKKVQHFGRWNLDTFHAYLWEFHEPMRPIARGMAADRTELTRPVTATKRGLAEAAGLSNDQDEAARALTWQKSKAGQRERTKVNTASHHRRRGNVPQLRGSTCSSTTSRGSRRRGTRVPRRQRSKGLLGCRHAADQRGQREAGRGRLSLLKHDIRGKSAWRH